MNPHSPQHGTASCRTKDDHRCCRVAHEESEDFWMRLLSRPLAAAECQWHHLSSHLTER
jgi:hypothetical protein